VPPPAKPSLSGARDRTLKPDARPVFGSNVWPSIAMATLLSNAPGRENAEIFTATPSLGKRAQNPTCKETQILE
jgi:hypothetical protein